MAELLDISNLPFSIQEKLKELDDDLEEGDITRKGYDKKRKQLLEQYTETTTNSTDTGRTHSPLCHSPIIMDLGTAIDDVDDNIGEDFSISVRKGAVQAATQTSRTNGPISSKRSNTANRFGTLNVHLFNTMDVGYKNTLGSSIKILITGMNNTVDTRTVFQMMVLISGMFLCQVFL